MGYNRAGHNAKLRRKRHLREQRRLARKAAVQNPAGGGSQGVSQPASASQP
jgi:hypothetical protein